MEVLVLEKAHQLSIRDINLSEVWGLDDVRIALHTAD